MRKRLGQTAIAVSPGTLVYTVPITPKVVYQATVLCMDIANTTAGALTIALYFVPVGDTASASNIILPTVTIAANTNLQWKGEQVLNSGDFIQAIGSATGLTITATGEVEKI